MRLVEGTILGMPVWSADRGALKVRFVGGVDAPLPEILAALSDAPREVSWLRQVHSDRVLPAAPGLRGEGDALIVTQPGLALAIATADCVPVVVGGVGGVAAIHAGWRGITGGIVQRAVDRLAALGPLEAAWIGPAIGPCCYEVGEEVAASVVAASGAEAERHGRGGRPHLDLATAVAAQLSTRGVRRVERFVGCTRCDRRLQSYRRDGAAARRNWTLAWLSTGDPA